MNEYSIGISCFTLCARISDPFLLHLVPDISSLCCLGDKFSQRPQWDGTPLPLPAPKDVRRPINSLLQPDPDERLRDKIVKSRKAAAGIPVTSWSLMEEVRPAVRVEMRTTELPTVYFEVYVEYDYHNRPNYYCRAYPTVESQSFIILIGTAHTDTIKLVHM